MVGMRPPALQEETLFIKLSPRSEYESRNTRRRSFPFSQNSDSYIPHQNSFRYLRHIGRLAEHGSNLEQKEVRVSWKAGESTDYP